MGVVIDYGGLSAREDSVSTSAGEEAYESKSINADFKIAMSLAPRDDKWRLYRF